MIFSKLCNHKNINTQITINNKYKIFHFIVSIFLFSGKISANAVYNNHPQIIEIIKGLFSSKNSLNGNKISVQITHHTAAI